MSSISMEIMIAEVDVVGDGLNLVIHDSFGLASFLLLQSLSLLLGSLNGRKLGLLRKAKSGLIKSKFYKTISCFML